MGDLEQLDPWQAPGEQLRIDLLLDVAGQEEPVRAERAEEHDRHVVDRRAPVRRVHRDSTRVGPEDLELDRVEGETVARRQGPARGTAAVERRGPGPVAGTGPDHAGLVHVPDLISGEEQRKPGDVVLMRVRKDKDVDPSIPWRQPFIEGANEAIRIGAAIDEETAPGPAFDEDPVALAHVEDRHAYAAARSLDDRQTERNHRRREGKRPEPRAVFRRGGTPGPPHATGATGGSG